MFLLHMTVCKYLKSEPKIEPGTRIGCAEAVMNHDQENKHPETEPKLDQQI